MNAKLALLSCCCGALLSWSASLGDDPPKLPEPALPADAPDSTTASGLLVQIHGPEVVKVGENFTCEVVITNETTTAIQNGGFAVHLTKGLKLRQPPSASSQPLKLEVGQTLKVPLELVAEKAGIQGVRAQIEADGGVQADAQFEITASASDFHVSLEGPAEHIVGQPLRYRIYVSNNTAETLEGTQLYVTVPEGIEIVSGEAGAMFNRRTRNIRWFVGRLAPNEERGFRLTMRPTTQGDLEIAALAQTGGGVESKDSRKTRLIGYTALGVTVEPSLDVVSANDLLAVVFDVKSRGSAPAKGVVLRLEKSPGLTIESERSPGWEEKDGGWEFHANQELPPGQALASTLTLRAVAAGNEMLKAEIRSEELSGPIVRTQPVLILSVPSDSPVATRPSAN